VRRTCVRTARHQSIGAAAAVAIVAAALSAWVSQGQASGDDIRGVVTGAAGPEAGVWVIAETAELPTKFRKIVVTDAAGKFLIPDLPSAAYQVWARGYGLADSAKTEARPGEEVALTARKAATPQEAAQIYPANYWYSLLEMPAESEFPGTAANGLGPDLPTQLHYVDRFKDRCELCHQMGNKPTREMPTLNLKEFPSTADAWAHRLQPSGMTNELNRLGRERSLKMLADWTDRISAGDVPPQPPRPQGRERNVVLTMWGWGSAQGGIHDNIATDKRNPRINANGPLYGVGGAGMLIADPVSHRSKQMALAGRSGHNPMMDETGRVWITQGFRPPDNPAWCKEGSDHPSAKYFPIERNVNDTRQLSYYDPKTGESVLIDTCFPTHHLQFADDEHDTVWLSGSTEVIGWVNSKQYDKTGDARLAQGWCPTVVDTNGDGRITRPWNEPTVSQANITTLTGKPFDPKLDTQLTAFAYGIIPNPVDGSIWIARRQPTPGSIVRLDVGRNPPETCRAEVYEPPFQDRNIDPARWGYGPRGIDVDRHGVIWTGLGGSGQLASFDRRKCKVLNGPTATGQHCPEGWTLYPSPGPKLKGVLGSPSADFHYYNWVDQFDTLGLGPNVPILNGSGSDSLLALLPDTREWLVMRVPYPMGFYTRGLNGRIDDPKAGWKGRGVWASYDTAINAHNEGGKGMTSEIVRFQIRPHPLAD
jgi:hypothetical protein